MPRAKSSSFHSSHAGRLSGRGTTRSLISQLTVKMLSNSQLSVKPHPDDRPSIKAKEKISNLYRAKLSVLGVSL